MNRPCFGTGLSYLPRGQTEEEVAPAIPWRLSPSGLGHSTNGTRHFSAAA